MAIRATFCLLTVFAAASDSAVPSQGRDACLLQGATGLNKVLDTPDSKDPVRTGRSYSPPSFASKAAVVSRNDLVQLDGTDLVQMDGKDLVKMEGQASADSRQVQTMAAESLGTTHGQSHPAGDAHSSHGNHHKSDDKGCPLVISVTGLPLQQSARMGDYVRLDDVKSHKPIYQHGEHFLFYWSKLGSWLIGRSLESDMSGIKSWNGENAPCPGDATGWLYWDGKQWLVGNTVSVKEVGKEDVAHGHVLEEASNTSRALGIMLFGTVGFVMAWIHLANSSHKKIQRCTFELLSSTLSIFCAVLFFTSVKDVTVFAFQENPGLGHGPPDKRTLLVTAFRYVIFVATFSVRLFYIRHDPRMSQATSLLGGHVLAFAAIDAFGDMQQMEIFRQTPFRSFVAAALASICMCVMAWMTCATRAKMLLARGSADEEQESSEEFQELCADAEDEAAALAVGFLVSHVVRFVISGSLASVHGDPKGKTKEDCTNLILAILLLVAMHAALHTVRSQCPKDLTFIRRAIRFVREVCSITAAWCVLALGAWQFWSVTGDAGLGEGDQMTARMILALAFSGIGFLVILSYHFHETAAILNIRPVSLVVALSWEGAFVHSVQSLSKDWMPGLQRTLLMLIFLLGTNVVVMTAWAWYVLPNTGEMRKQHDRS